jgi:hypothetical protein
VLGSVEAALTLPIVMTANMIFMYRPRGQAIFSRSMFAVVTDRRP